jgi:hypothetical protein
MSDIFDDVWYDHIEPLDLKAHLGVIIEFSNHRDKGLGGLFAAVQAVGHSLNESVSRNSNEQLGLDGF